MQNLRNYATAAANTAKNQPRLTWHQTGNIRPETTVGMPPEDARKMIEEGIAMVPKLKKILDEGKITSANIQFVSYSPPNIHRQTACEPHETRKADGTIDPEHYAINTPINHHSLPLTHHTTLALLHLPNGEPKFTK
ncbi:hypothetical protein CERZMDRAFT_96164 [Cercospora zeae-maydis SCOH1-5]|uniref:Uncharacterized protein n=1 Tax=Cercospora zeae-maydis SCOH1-5 TaxID=717836 RepID=A0A6A6FKZ1_9PEZI|nr:hypothetical protein CERZMDRAFT_96164 [Cercospora zeae-maydis SCOH1-5]